MKNFTLSFCLLSALMFTLNSCQKDEKKAEGAQDAVEAEFRLGSAGKWIIYDAILNGEYVMKNKVLLDPEQDGMAEWLIFDTDQKTIEVKYPNEVETYFFDYVIEDDNLKVFAPDGFEELMTIKSGSVYTDHFMLEQVIDSDKFEVILVKE